MGATNCPETPRQRLIGMMYLVLTAMLALNVSKDILNAFVIVDETLVNSTKIMQSNIANDDYQLDKQKMILGEDKVADAIGKAAKVKNLSNDLVTYIEKLRGEFIAAVDDTEKNKDGSLKSVKDIGAKDNISKASNFMIGQPNKRGRAFELKEKISTYRTEILKLIDNEEDRKNLDKIIGLEMDKIYRNKDNKEETWEAHYFENTIAVACVTLLNKTINEVFNAESNLMKYIISKISSDDYKFNKIEGRAIPNSRMVFLNENYAADIIVAAYDDKQTPEIYYKMGIDTLANLEGANKLDGSEGVVHLKLPAGSVGDFKYAGVIVVKGPDGLPRHYGFNDKYTVLRPSATVAAEKMNVFYAGIENPISVNAPVDPGKINISLSGGTYSKSGPGTYNVTVTEALAGKTVTVRVTADAGGKANDMGTTTFRVKRVPDPECKIGGSIRGGRVTKTDLTVNPFLTAKMGDDFVYDLMWRVTSFRVTFSIRGVEEAPIACQGAAFNENVLAKIRSAPVGTTIFFTEIRATSPVGQRGLNDIAIRIR